MTWGWHLYWRHGVGICIYKFECMDDHAMHCLAYWVLATIIKQSVSHFLIFNVFSLIFFWFFKTIFFFCSRVSSPGSPNRGGDLLTQVGMAPREINWRNNPYVGCLPWASYPLLPKLSLTVLFVLESDHVFLPTNFDPILGPLLELDSFLFSPFLRHQTDPSFSESCRIYCDSFDACHVHRVGLHYPPPLMSRLRALWQASFNATKRGSSFPETRTFLLRLLSAVWFISA